MDKMRKQKILEKLDENGYIMVGTISKILGCTEVTLRRDLTVLEKEGLLKRVHGGAIKIGNNFVHKNVKDSLYVKIYEKMEIAKMAYEVIEEGDTILIDDASTSIHLGNMIMNDSSKHVTVITNSIILAEKLLNCPHVELIVIGGETVKNLAATSGEIALQQFNEVHAEKAFIGVNGIDFDKGITLMGYPQCKVKKKMMSVSTESYILADSDKFEKYYMSYLCDAKDVTAILTDQDISEKILKEATEKKIKIITKFSKTNKNQ